MSALEVGQPKDTVPTAPTGTVTRQRRRSALSIRERRVLLASGNFTVGALAALLAYGVVHRPIVHPLEFYDPLLIGAIWVTALLIADGYAF